MAEDLKLNPIAQSANQNTYLPPGQTPLASNPEYGGAGGSQQAADFYTARDFAQIFGRNPTQSELAMLSGAYMSGDPNIANVAGGKSAVAQYYNSLSMTPANLYAQQQQQWQSNAPKNYDAVNQLFQTHYGRAPSQDELQHYGTLLASGQADAYTLGQFMQSLPEYQDAQDKKFRTGLDQDLQKSDQDFFNRVSPTIAQRYALMGTPTSPALAVAMTDLAAQLSSERGKYLSQLGAQQYGGNKQAALGQYESNRQGVQNSMYGNSQAQYNNLLGVQNRTNEISDYALQNQNYNRLLGQQGGLGPLDYLNTAFNGIGSIAKGYQAYKTPGGG